MMHPGQSCEHCGAPIVLHHNILICEYCGVEYGIFTNESRQQENRGDHVSLLKDNVYTFKYGIGEEMPDIWYEIPNLYDVSAIDEPEDLPLNGIITIQFPPKITISLAFLSTKITRMRLDELIQRRHNSQNNFWFSVCFAGHENAFIFAGEIVGISPGDDMIRIKVDVRGDLK